MTMRFFPSRFFDDLNVRTPSTFLAGLSLLTLFFVGTANAVDIQKVTSPGGIKAWLVEEQTVPIVAMNFAFKGGYTQDPQGKGGLVNLLSSMLDEGAADLDSQAFQRALEETQARISFSAGRDEFYGEIRTLSFLADGSFELLRKALTKPLFDVDPLERMRNQILVGIRRSETDPDSIANRALFSALFPEHPYGRRSSGDLESVATLNRDDLVDLHKNLFTKDTLTVAVVGAITPDELGALLDKVFGDLPNSGTLLDITEAKPVIGETITKSLDVPQSSIRVALPSIKRKDPDFLAAFVMNHILGGGSFTSRLYSEVREKRGLVYSVYSHLMPMERSALFFIGAGSRSENAQVTIDLIREEIKRMGKDGPTEEELQKAKDYLTGSYALRFDTSNKIAGQLLGLQLNDLPAEYIETRNDQIAALTLEDVKKAASKILATGDPAIVIVGQNGS